MPIKSLHERLKAAFRGEPQKTLALGTKRWVFYSKAARVIDDNIWSDDKPGAIWVFQQKYPQVNWTTVHEMK